MKFVLDSARSAYTIRSYAATGFVVGEQEINQPLVITADGLHLDWLPTNFTELSLDHLHAVVKLGVEIIIIGTGATQIFLPTSLNRTLNEERIGIEVMNTPAACRCYNVLVAEARAVAGVLYPSVVAP